VFYFRGERQSILFNRFFGNNIDVLVLGKSHLLHADKVNGKIYHFDYEGLTSSIAAIVQVLFGYLVGHYIQQKGKTYKMLLGLFVSGTVMVLIGYCWDMVFPISKKMWTSSYTVYTTGWAILTIATMIFLVEFKNLKGWWTKFLMYSVKILCLFLF